VAEELNPKELVTPDELAISTMGEIAALVVVLELRHVESGTVAVLSPPHVFANDISRTWIHCC